MSKPAEKPKLHLIIKEIPSLISFNMPAHCTGQFFKLIWSNYIIIFLCKVNTIPFVDLQNFPGVVELNREADAHSDPIFIRNGLLFGKRRVTSAYVS